MTILVTGGAGFIGSNFVLDYLAQKKELVVNVDKLTYAGSLENLASVINDPQHIFLNEDIGNVGSIKEILLKYKPRAVINFAAETHVDQSINNPEKFIQTNIVSTFHFLQCVKEYWEDLLAEDYSKFKFLNVSTDEVYGDLKDHDPPFIETSPLLPNNPYAASKASFDHLVRSFYKTYNFPAIITRCSNNFGPCQHPEKLIPLMISRAISGQKLPVYGSGKNIRDWIFVLDHCKAIQLVLDNGIAGSIYNIGGKNEKTNLEIVYKLCDILDALCSRGDCLSYHDFVTFVPDRPGHDFRYAIDATKICNELNWNISHSFEDSLRKTVQWYLTHRDRLANCTD